MIFHIHSEGKTERIAIEQILIKLFGKYGHLHEWKHYKHQGIGTLPDDPSAPPNTRNRTLLHNLPSLLRAYGNCLGSNEAVIVLLDLDDKNYLDFTRQLFRLLRLCPNKPKTLFRFAIEELESWFLGDINALTAAFPSARITNVSSYTQDSICGTWEFLADIIYPGGINRMKQLGSIKILEEKCNWACKIAPYLDINNNNSKSFNFFIRGIKRLAK